MRNVPIDEVDDLPLEVLALGTDYPYGTFLPTHRHRRAQFLYAINGLMEVETQDGKWMVLPLTGVWIPPGKAHSVCMIGVSTRSLYIEPAAAPRQGKQCEVLQVTPLMHQLLLAANMLSERVPANERDAALITLLLHEIRLAAPLASFLPLPHEPKLAALCATFLQQPNIHVRPEQWANVLNKSPRTFSRLFRRETGFSFSAWRQQACLMSALNSITAGMSVTEVALSLGYESLSAFITMFRKAMGYAPAAFTRQTRGT